MEKWITIKGNHILLKDGETPEQALERLKNGMHKSDRLYDNNETPKMEKSNKLYENDIPKMEKEKLLTKSSKQSIVYLPKKEYGKMCHAIRTRYADKIPKRGSIFLSNNYYSFRYSKKAEKIVCDGKLSIIGNEKKIDKIRSKYGR